MVLHCRCCILQCVGVPALRKRTQKSLGQRITNFFWPLRPLTRPLVDLHGSGCWHTVCISGRVICFDLLRSACPAELGSPQASGKRYFSAGPTRVRCSRLDLVVATPNGKAFRPARQPARTVVSLTTEDGRALTSAELRGKVVILAFWATWCEPCWHELPR